jgi:hypothetical protein
MIRSILSNIIDLIEKGELRQAEDHAVALRDDDLPPLTRQHRRRDKGSENSPPSFHPDRDRASRVEESLGKLISQLARKDAGSALTTAHSMRAEWDHE